MHDGSVIPSQNDTQRSLPKTAERMKRRDRGGPQRTEKDSLSPFPLFPPVQIFLHKPAIDRQARRSSEE